MEWLVDMFMVAVGYAASIFTWPWLTSKFQSVQTQVAKAEASLAALKAKL